MTQDVAHGRYPAHWGTLSELRIGAFREASIASEEVARIDLLFDIGQFLAHAV